MLIKKEVLFMHAEMTSFPSELISKMVCRVCLYGRPAPVLLRTFCKDFVLYILILLLLLLFVNSFS